MRIGSRSRELMELLAVFGMETFEAIMALPFLYQTTQFTSEKSLREKVLFLNNKGWIRLEQSPKSGDWVAGLTKTGKSILTGDIDPEVAWKTPWDGKWRVLSFDLPREAWRQRYALKEWLLELRFGRLQGSVWITPCVVGDLISKLAEIKVDPRAVVIVVGELGGAKSDEEHVKAAWDFELINHRYEVCLKFLDSHGNSELSPQGFAAWFREERVLWHRAFEADPFLPEQLWPKKYLAPKAFRQRKEVYRLWSRSLGIAR